MSSNEMKKIILHYVNEKNHVSFIEIENLFKSNGFDYKGEFSITPNSDYKNVIIWGGWNNEALDTVMDLVKDKRIEMEPTENITYLIDGGGLKLPLVTRFFDYKTPHWIPTVLVRVN